MGRSCWMLRCGAVPPLKTPACANFVQLQEFTRTCKGSPICLTRAGSVSLRSIPIVRSAIGDSEVTTRLLSRSQLAYRKWFALIVLLRGYFYNDTETGFPDVLARSSSSWGLGECVVKGTVTPDEFLVFKPLLEKSNVKGVLPIIRQKLGQKPSR